jgi:hypothetical protein
MRFLAGIMVGMVLTAGSAWLFDTTRRSEGPGGAAERPMVNWDVVQAELKLLSGTVQGGWTRLTGRRDG